MDDFDERPIAPRLTQLQRENLDPQSVDELEERISVLKTEIARTEQVIESKRNTRQTADDFFKK